MADTKDSKVRQAEYRDPAPKAPGLKVGDVAKANVWQKADGSLTNREAGAVRLLVAEGDTVTQQMVDTVKG